MIAGLQSGFTDQHLPQQSPSSSGLQPSCPPYWMISSSQQTRLATNWEPNTETCLHSLTPAVNSSAEFSNSDRGDTKSVIQKPKTCLSRQVSLGDRPFILPGLSRAFTPDFLSLSASLSSLKQQHEKDLLQRSLSKQHSLNQMQKPSMHHADISPPNTRVKTTNWHSVREY